MKRITTEDVMNELLTHNERVEIENEVMKEVVRLRGGKRDNSGRKSIIKGKVLKLCQLKLNRCCRSGICKMKI